MLFGCKLKALRPHQAIDAAAEAVRINPTNAVRPSPAAALLPRAEIAMLVGKYWGAKGVKLGVSFMDTQDSALKKKILEHMNSWNTAANVVFQESASGEVRIARADGQGYYSYLGTDILLVPRGEPTMNLEAFTVNTPDGEYRRVVRHETAHTWGAPHEHQRKVIVQRIDPPKAYAYFQRWDNWDRQTVDQQVLTSLDEGSLMSTPADVISIMAYSLPGEIMKDGVAVPGGDDIDASDYAFAAKVYPKAVGPVVPPPGTKAGIQLDADMVKGNYVAVLSSLTWPTRVIHIAVDGLIPAGKHEVK